ncbi:MAG: hypothetical protein SPLUMA2_SPLUMAMAG2_00543 [uncultured Sulfurimonas sp.]|nr:MAG: hypothetical protein SPLUMA1_SPLUMAMAG1_01082 [uncultured Sulfurimonas sp.]CAI6155357.1 MAG: hypothetical protein SPLUMA2_SPLUMAMAG2_00543 [uncultured Sulfurimonas sp.]
MMQKVFLGIQVVAGLMLVVFGLNKFVDFIPMAAPAPEMGIYMSALFTTGFIFPLIAVIEIVSGLAFISNKFASFMVLIMAPVMVNAFLAHLLLDPTRIGGTAFISFALIIIMIRNKDRYKEIFKV